MYFTRSNLKEKKSIVAFVLGGKSGFDILLSLNKYKKQRNHVNNLKKHAKEQFYFNVNTLLYTLLDDFSSSNSKSYWSFYCHLM
jgi:hypothetical protein